MSIVDNLKLGLKRSLSDPKKLGIYTAFNAVIMILLFGSLHFIFEPLVNTAHNLANVNATAANSIFTIIPQHNFIISTILVILAIVLSIYVSGYAYKLIECAIKKEQEFPDFSDVKTLLISGVKMAVVGFVYTIIPSLITYAAPQISQATHLPILGAIISFIGFVLGIIAFLLCIMATNNMIANNSFKDAFNFDTVKSLISSIGWLRFLGAIIFLCFILMILILAVTIVLVLIVGVLALAGPIGIKIGLVIMFIVFLLAGSYMNFVTCLFYGALYNEAI